MWLFLKAHPSPTNTFQTVEGCALNKVVRIVLQAQQLLTGRFAS
jgi:hypothetical protein